MLDQAEFVEADVARARAALARCIALAGNPTELLRLIQRRHPHLRHGHMYHWQKKAERGVPAEFCRAVSEAVGWQVSVHELRPDVFGPEPPAASLERREPQAEARPAVGLLTPQAASLVMFGVDDRHGEVVVDPDCTGCPPGGEPERRRA